MTATVICPYLNETEIHSLRSTLGWKIPTIFEEDISGLGSDLMYQKLWKQCSTDVILFHADMMPLPKDTENNWYFSLLEYASRYPEAGMLGCKLLYPAENEEGNYIIQSAGGKFTDKSIPDYFGTGRATDVGSKITKTKEVDKGQYDYVREVAWSTFGGIFIRRQVINDVGDFDPSFEWTYNRDVDYCLSARKKGWRIYQVPVSLFHFESRDNNFLKEKNEELVEKERANLKKLKEKWKDSVLYTTINLPVNKQDRK